MISMTRQAGVDDTQHAARAKLETRTFLSDGVRSAGALLCEALRAELALLSLGEKRRCAIIEWLISILSLVPCTCIISCILGNNCQ